MYKLKKILIIGSSGMLGNILVQYLSEKKNLKVYGLQRSRSITTNKIKFFFVKKFTKDKLFRVIKSIKPDFVINCAGLINHKIKKNNIDEAFYINSDLPNLLAEGAKYFNFSLVHISTDCVFDGKKGNYTEKDLPNAKDIYGVSKSLGEMAPSTIILTSIIGEELANQRSLLEWVRSEEGCQIYGTELLAYN